MAKAKLFNQAGEQVADQDLNPAIFELKTVDEGLVHQVLTAQRLNARKPWAHTKTRGEVAGSGKKPWRQKGTGRARAGSVRSPLWRHGGITFGPRNTRDWSVKINKKMFRKALFSVLTDKERENKIVLIESIPTISKTAQLAKFFADLSSKTGLSQPIALLLPKYSPQLEKASRNLENAKILYANKLNVKDLLGYDLVIAKDSLSVLEETYLKPKK